MRATAVPPLLPSFLIALSLAAAAGCGEPFPPANRIQELRVLAIKSEPVAPAPGESTTLSALVYTPMPDPSVTYAWSWCPLPGASKDGYPCLIDEAQLQSMAGMAGQTLPPYNLGNGETAQLPHTIDPVVLQQLCAARAATVVGGQPLGADCDGGFPVQIKVTVKTATDEVTAVRRLRLRLAPGGEPNNNPRIEGLSLIEETPDGMEIATSIEEGMPRTLFRAPEDQTLRATVPLEVAEPYTGKDNNLQPTATRERLSMVWFIESGDTDEDTTSFVADLVGARPITEAFTNTWSPARVKDYPRDTARLILVLKDNREGVVWRDISFRLMEAP